MPAPVVSLSPVPSTSAAGSVAAGVNSGLGSSALFGSFLSPNANLSLFKVETDTSIAETSSTQTDVGAPSSMMIKGGTLMLFAQDGQDVSLEGLKSLLASMGDASSELDTKILMAMTAGTPSNDLLANIKSQISDLGLDPSKISIVGIKPTTDLPHPLTSLMPSTDVSVPTPELTLDSASADNSQNILLVATGLNPSDMEAFKEAIKTALNGSTTSVGEGDEEILSATDKPLTPADATDDAALIALVVFVAPIQQATLPVTTQDAAFDLSSLSAFTQPPADDLAEADWGQKLSDKLSGMTLLKGANDDLSPFDAEMNEILSYDLAPKEDAGFKGSLSILNSDSKTSPDKVVLKDVNGEMTTQAGQSLSHAAFTANAFAPAGDHSLLYTNGGIAAAQQASANMTNPLLTSAAASSAHPSVHAVASLIEKSTSGSEKAKQELSVQLDPPELGRMQIQLSTEKDGVMKVHLIAEKQDTVTMFQRDSHALKSALENAGIQLDNSSLTFDFAGGGQSFDQLMSGQDNSGAKTSRMAISADGTILNTDNMQMMETVMDFRTDNLTGNVHYSFLT